HITGEEESKVALRGETPVRQRRITRSQDDVRAEIDIQLLLQRRGHVDLREHTEALSRERFAHPLHRLLVRRAHYRREAIPCRLLDHHSLLGSRMNNASEYIQLYTHIVNAPADLVGDALLPRRPVAARPADKEYEVRVAAG